MPIPYFLLVHSFLPSWPTILDFVLTWQGRAHDHDGGFPGARLIQGLAKSETGRWDISRA